MKTATDKLLKKEFKFSSSDEIWKLIDKKKEMFFEHHFFCSKEDYVKKLRKMINDINATSILIGEEIQAMKHGSIVQQFASSAYVETMPMYKSMRKALVNQVELIIRK